MDDRDLVSIQEARTLAHAAREAQIALAELTQAEIDSIVESMANAATEHAEALARIAVDETGYGVAADKVIMKTSTNIMISSIISTHLVHSFAFSHI